MIPVPEHYRDWFKKSVKIILLEQEPPNVLPIKQDTLTEQNTWLGCMSDTGQIIGDIVSPIDDNLNNWEVLAK